MPKRARHFGQGSALSADYNPAKSGKQQRYQCVAHLGTIELVQRSLLHNSFREMEGSPYSERLSELVHMSGARESHKALQACSCFEATLGKVILSVVRRSTSHCQCCDERSTFDLGLRMLDNLWCDWPYYWLLIKSLSIRIFFVTFSMVNCHVPLTAMFNCHVHHCSLRISATLRYCVLRYSTSLFAAIFTIARCESRKPLEIVR